MNTSTLTRIWLLLLLVTLISTALVDTATPGIAFVVAICGAVSLKGTLVVDRLMGLWGTHRPVRWSMLSYFYLVPLIIALAWLFPELLREITTL